MEEISDWLELETALGSIEERNERMPKKFRDPHNIDKLCESCRSLPWEHIRRTATEMEGHVRETIPTVQRRFDGGRYGKDCLTYQYTTLQALCEGALGGCHLCVLLLWTEYGRAPKFALPMPKSHVRSLRKAKLDEQLSLEIYLERNRFGLPTSIVASMGLSGSRQDARLIMSLDVPSSPPPGTPLRQAPSTVTIGRHWIDVCSEHHKVCSKGTREAPRLPKRVIRLVRQDGSIKAHLCIDTAHTAHYVALSHRWSSSQSVLLTTTNIQELSQCIPLAQLSRTFREAFEVVCDLGFEYIWIDALCIMQDSRDDWLEQSSKMAEIYCSAFITVCAHTSRDGVGQCQTSIPPNLIDSPCQIMLGMFIYPGPEPRDGELVEGTAKTRAWIMQEEIFSQRILYCGASRVSWACGEMTWNDNQPSARPSKYQYSQVTDMRQIMASLEVSRYQAREISRARAFIEWKSLIVEYTLRELSYHSDKLPALSAVARKHGESLHYPASDYLAGIWRQDLPEALLWKRAPGRGCSDPTLRALHRKRCEQDTETENLPSWSWSSQDGPISFWIEHQGGCIRRSYSPAEHQLISVKCQVLQAEALSKTLNPHGEVARASITLRGLALLNLKDSAEPAEESPPRSRRRQYDLYWDRSQRDISHCILVQITREAGIVLERLERAAGDEALGDSNVDGFYRRAGMVISSGVKPLCRVFSGGEWEERTITVF